MFAQFCRTCTCVCGRPAHVHTVLHAAGCGCRCGCGCGGRCVGVRLPNTERANGGTFQGRSHRLMREKERDKRTHCVGGAAAPETSHDTAKRQHRQSVQHLHSPMSALSRARSRCGGATGACCSRTPDNGKDGGRQQPAAAAVSAHRAAAAPPAQPAQSTLCRDADGHTPRKPTQKPRRNVCEKN